MLQPYLGKRREKHACFFVRTAATYVSGVPLTVAKEWYRMEPLTGLIRDMVSWMIKAEWQDRMKDSKSCSTQCN